MDSLQEEKIPKGWKLLFGVISIIVSTVLSAYLTPSILTFIVHLSGVKKDQLPVSSMLVGSFTLLFNFVSELLYYFVINSIKVLDSSLTSSISDSSNIKLKIGQNADVEWHLLFTGRKVYKSEKSVFVEFPDWLDITVKGSDLLKNDKSRPNKYSVCLETLIDNEITFVFSIAPKYASGSITSTVRIENNGIYFFRRKKIKNMTIMFIE